MLAISTACSDGSVAKSIRQARMSLIVWRTNPRALGLRHRLLGFALDAPSLKHLHAQHALQVVDIVE